MLYHGGCHNCKHVEDVFPCYCKQCRYYKPDWSLPDLNDSHYSTEISSLIYGGLEGLHEYLNRKNMKNKIIIEGKEFELPDELVNKIKEELNKPKKLTYEYIFDELEKTIPEDNQWYTDFSDTCFSENQVKKLSAINKLMNVAKYLNGEWKHDNNFKSSNADWKFALCIGGDGLFVEGQLCVRGTVYFRTKELAQQAIDILGEDTIKLALSTDW